MFKKTLRHNVTGMRQTMILPGNKLNKLITYSYFFTYNVQKKIVFTVFAERGGLWST
jgi:hypothetical protein